MTDLDLAFSPVHDLAAAIRGRRLSPVDLVEALLERIAAHDEKLHSFVTVYGEDARLAAQAAEKAIRAGHAVGPLHGIPVALKDIIDLEGRVTTGGSLALKDRGSTVTATLAKKLIAAGMIVIGKTHSVEFAMGGWGTNQHMGTPWNPWDGAVHRAPGGSSAGTGAGLSAHFGTVGLGSETGFSIRTPSSDSNVFGLSTTSGLISRAGQMWSYITGERGGPMAHTVYDLAATLDVIAGFDSADLWTANSLGKMPLKPYVSFLDPEGLKGARVGVLKEAWDFTPVDPAVIEMAKAAIAVFAANGAAVFDPVALDIDLPEYLDVNVFPSASMRSTSTCRARVRATRSRTRRHCSSAPRCRSATRTGRTLSTRSTWTGT